VRLQLFALAYNLGNFLQRLALPKPVKHWSLTTLREKLTKIGAKVVRHAKYVTFPLAEVAVPRLPPIIPIFLSSRSETWSDPNIAWSPRFSTSSTSMLSSASRWVAN
jgi:hypothetical protein